MSSAEPLPDERYEQFAQLRAVGAPIAIAAMEAGLRTEDNRAIAPGDAARIDRRADVRARKASIYLACIMAQLARRNWWPEHDPRSSILKRVGAVTNPPS